MMVHRTFIEFVKFFVVEVTWWKKLKKLFFEIVKNSKRWKILVKGFTKPFMSTTTSFILSSYDDKNLYFGLIFSSHKNLKKLWNIWKINEIHIKIYKHIWII